MPQRRQPETRRVLALAADGAVTATLVRDVRARFVADGFPRGFVRTHPAARARWLLGPLCPRAVRVPYRTSAWVPRRGHAYLFDAWAPRHCFQARMLHADAGSIYDHCDSCSGVWGGSAS